MFEVIVIVGIVTTIILLKIFLNINFKNIKKLQNRTCEELEKMTDKFPDDEKICKDILNKINNKSNVKVVKQEEFNSSLYTVFNNTITIGKFKQNYIKIQTIAHECIHSMQNKRVLWCNFIYSNIYIIYFVIISILTLLNKIQNTKAHIFILLIAGLVHYVIRNYLETDAMIKAKFIAKEYLEESKILNKEERIKLLEEYDTINSIGIPFINYYTIVMNLAKVIIYVFISLA